MDLTAASDQWAPAGIHILPANPASFLDPLRTIAHNAQCRLVQFFVNRLMRRAARALADDPAGFPARFAPYRAWYDRVDKPFLPMMEADAVKVAARALPGGGRSSPVPAEWFAPRASKPEGVVFYVHGGSFVVERSPRITALVARFAAAADARVFAPNYRLAPEHPCPAAVDDIVAAYRWHTSLWPEEPMVALAESAGAAILLAALQKIRDASETLPRGIVLLSPWVDLALQSWSVVMASLLNTTPYTMESMAVMVHLYLQGMPATDPVASPIYGDFTGFPPMLIHASKQDILYNDATRLAEKVRQAGGDLTVRFWSNEVHVWERMHSAKARQSIAFAAKFIRQRLDASELA